MTRKELSARSRVALSSLVLLEQGRLNPNLKTLEKVAQVLRVRVVDLLSEEEVPPKPTQTTKVFGRIVQHLRDRDPSYLLTIEKLIHSFDRAVEIEAEKRHREPGAAP